MNILSETLSGGNQYFGRRQRFVLFAAIYVTLWIATWYSARLLNSYGVVSLWFLPAGLRFCSLLVLGGRGVLLELGVQCVFALMQLTQLEGEPIREILSSDTLWRLYNLLASLAANAALILPLRHWIRESWDLTRPGHGAVFLGTSLTASALSALIGTIGLMHLGVVESAHEAEVFAGWLIGDFIGIITLTPFLLVRITPGLCHYLEQGSWYAQREAGTQRKFPDFHTTLIVLPALLLVFGVPWAFGLNQHFPLVALLLLLPLAAVATRYGLHGAVLAIALLDGGLVVLMALFDKGGQALPYQLVMIAIALVGLWLGGAVESRNRIMVRYRDFAGVSNDLLWETDSTGRFVEVSGQLADQFSLTKGKSWRSVLGDGPQPHLVELESALKNRQRFHHLDIALRNAEGGAAWIQVNGLPLLDDAGELIGYRGTAVDVSQVRQAEALLRNYNDSLRADVAERTRALHHAYSELETKERHLQVLLAAAPVGMLELDETQRCRLINVNGCALTGYSPEQAQGMPMLDFVHPDDRDYVKFVWQINGQSDQVQRLEFRLNRTGLRCEAHWIQLTHSSQSMDGTIMVLTNATARSQQDERLWTLAHHDALTDLPNRNLFWERMGQALRHAKRKGSGVALLWVDLDGFKAVNDRLGHAAGDALLQQVAQRLKKRIRESDTVARMGGDEFAVIMPEIVEPEGAVQVASALIDSLVEPFELQQGTASISCSVGVALYPRHAETIEGLTQCSDMAMYAAKNAGKRRVQVWQGA